MFRRFLIAVMIFLVVIVIAVDRLGAIVGAHVLATKLQSDEGLPSRPSASIGGIPFLTQAIGGNYKDVSVTAKDVPVNGVMVSVLTAHLHGVRVPLGKIFHGSVSHVPVSRVDGSAFVTYADANSYLAHHGPAHTSIVLSSGTDGQIRVAEQAKIAGHAVSLSGTGQVSVVGTNVVRVSITSLKGTTKVLGHTLSAEIPVDLRSISIPLPGLPFRFKLTSVTASSTGVTGTGTARHVVLGGQYYSAYGSG